MGTERIFCPWQLQRSWFFFGGGVILRIINFFMFIKRKKNRSGTVSIVVAEKISGYHKEFTIHIFNWYWVQSDLFCRIIIYNIFPYSATSIRLCIWPRILKCKKWFSANFASHRIGNSIIYRSYPPKILYCIIIHIGIKNSTSHPPAEFGESNFKVVINTRLSIKFFILGYLSIKAVSSDSLFFFTSAIFSIIRESTCLFFYQGYNYQQHLYFLCNKFHLCKKLYRYHS